jgi:hypothetical protein
MTAGRGTRIYLGQSGEGCKHGWVSLVLALRIAAEFKRRLGLAESKGNKHGWTAYKLRKFDWLYISLPRAEAQGVRNSPGCSAVGLRHKHPRELGRWLDVIENGLLCTLSKRRCNTQTEDPHISIMSASCAIVRAVLADVLVAVPVCLLSFAAGTWRPDRTPP